MKIGNLTLENPVFLAPMAGITDRIFRILCKEQGCGMTFTEMISAKGIFYQDSKSAKIGEVDATEKPIAIQLFGSEPLILAKITEKLNPSHAALIDINMGCPAPKITKNGEGAALMKNPLQIQKIVKAVVEASEKPISVKIRKGWDQDSVNAVEVAKIIEQAGASLIIVHGRTREEGYSGQADWNIIRKVKAAVSIPVIGNGDVVDALSAQSMLEITGCDGVMIGRAAQGNPWIFREVTSFLKEGILISKPDAYTRMQTMIRHLQSMMEEKGKHWGMIEMRKHFEWYLKGLKDAAELRQKIFAIEEADILMEMLSRHLNAHAALRDVKA